MDDEVRSERPALAQYRQMLDSGELSDLAFCRELAVREYGESIHRLLDAHDVGPADSLRDEVAGIAQTQRALLRLLGPDLLEDEPDLLEGEAS
jgi:hypothetical protein